MAASTMMEEVWSENIESIGDSVARFVGNELLADMTFIVGPEKKRVPGHKFILAISSREFYNALCLLRVDRDELPIQDVSHDHFMVFLQYCYTRNEEIIKDISLECLLNLLKLAQRFDMKHLKKICETKILKNWKYYNNAIYYFQEYDFLPMDSPIRMEFLNLVVNYFNFLTQNEQLLKAFLDLPSKKVEEILTRDDLNCREIVLFNLLMKWSKNACENSNIEPTPRNLRRKVGNLISKIAFPTMTTEEFTDILAEYPDVLTGKEITDILRTIKGQSEFCPHFRNHQRKYKIMFNSVSGVNSEFIPCTEYLQKDAVSSEFSIRFKTMEKLKISEFAVTVTPDKVIRPEVCTLTWTDLDTSVEKCIQKKCELGKLPDTIKKVFWDCDFFSFSFTAEVLLPGIWYTLYCRFPEPIPDRTNGIVNCAQKFKIEIAASESNLPPVPFLIVEELNE